MGQSIERGCGKRVKGGLYACCGLSPNGKPIEHFLIDPPGPYKGEPFRAPIIQEERDVKHLVFWVGAQHYPFCPDFIEETRNFGVSKRIPLGTDLSGIEASGRKGVLPQFPILLRGHGDSERQSYQEDRLHCL